MYNPFSHSPSSCVNGNAIAATTVRLLLIVVAGLLLLLSPSELLSQDEPLPPYRFGLLVGGNYNMISLDSAGVDPYDSAGRLWGDNDGVGIGPYIGGHFSYVPGVIGLQVRAAYDSRNGIFVDSTDPDVGATLAYFSVDPALRITPGTSGLHFVVGPSLNFRVSDGIEFPDETTPGAGTESPILGSKGSIVSLFGGVGYDIALSRDYVEKTAWILTPFLDVSYIPEQNGADNRDWQTTTVRLGLGLSYAFSDDEDEIDDTPPPDRLSGGISLDVETPRVASGESRQLDEYFPLLNYLFFNTETTELPGSYRRLSSSSAARFSEGDLIEEGPTSGPDAPPSRAAQQLRVYDNAVNIVSARMRENPETTIDLVGADPDPARGAAMAEGVKKYMVETFGIDPSRITTRGTTRAPHASGTRSTPREDLDFITEENRRVEMLTSDTELLKPVRINTTESNLVENDLLFKLNLTGAASVKEWDLVVESEDSDFSQAYGPFYTGVARINSSPLMQGNDDNFRAIARATTHEEKELEVTEKFSLRESSERPSSATRYSILFEYDDSKSVTTYDQFLRDEVAPAIPDGATVYVFGHTDVTGRDAYNRELSARRSSETKRILTDALSALGRSAKFDAYGFGETAFRSPFGNGSPEERYYNRTVIIEIVPPTAE